MALLIVAIWKSLCSFKVKRDQEARDNQFLFQNVQKQPLNQRLLDKKQMLVVLGLFVYFILNENIPCKVLKAKCRYTII